MPDFGNFLGGLLQGGVQGYNQGFERKRLKAEDEMRRREMEANIASANAALKTQEFQRQQAQEVADRMKMPFRQAVVGTPYGFMDAASGKSFDLVSPQQERMGRAMEGLGPIAELPMRDIPQALDLMQFQQSQAASQAEADYRNALLEQERQRTELERTRANAPWAPISGATAGIFGPEFAGMPRGELEMAMPYLSAGLRAGGGADGAGGGAGGLGRLWSEENALAFYKAQQDIQNTAFSQGLGMLMQKDPDLSTKYQEAVTQNEFRPLSTSQMISLMTPEQQEWVMTYAQGTAQDLWEQALNMGFPKQAPGFDFQGSVESMYGAAPPAGGGWTPPAQPSAAPTMSGYYSPGAQQQIDVQAQQLLQQHPWLGQNPEYQGIMPTGQTVLEYLAEQVASGIPLEQAMTEVGASKSIRGPAKKKAKK